MIHFGREYHSNIVDEILPLFKKHHEEISKFKDVPLDPDFAIYDACEAAGVLRLYTARKQGKLVGYAVFIMRKHPHYQSIVQANQTLLFIDPDHRGFGMKFIAWCDEQLKADGVGMIQHGVTERCDFSLILKRLGYELTERLYVRRI